MFRIGKKNAWECSCEEYKEFINKDFYKEYKKFIEHHTGLSVEKIALNFSEEINRKFIKNNDIF
jgi:hypothetical protein